MITMLQLEELESRVIKALHLIGELRAENSHLESENEALKGEAEDVRLTLEEREQEIERIRKELDRSNKILQELKDREEILEEKVLGLLGKFDVLQTEMSAPFDSSSSDTAGNTLVSSQSVELDTLDFTEDDADIILDSDDENFDEEQVEDDVALMANSDSDGEVFEEEDEEVIIDDESDSAEGESFVLDDGEDIGFLDDDGDEIVLIDDDEEVFVEEDEGSEVIIEDEDFDKSAGKDEFGTDDDFLNTDQEKL